LTILVGWHFLSEDDDGPPLGAATFLDVAGAGPGMKSAERLVRPYFKGVPDAASTIAKARAWTQQGCRVVVGNEPNLPMEGWSGGVENLAMLFEKIRSEAPAARIYWPGMSPAVPGWQEWVSSPWAMDGIAAADGAVVHAYGTFDQMRAVVQFYLDTLLHAPLWVSEVNFGAGQQADRDAWARDHFRPFLDWCSQHGRIEAVTYFAHRWSTPDMSLPTPVDGAGTGIERVLREWKAPVISPEAPPVEQPPRPAPVVGVPAKKEPTPMLRLVDLSNYQGLVDMSGWKAAGIDGAIVRVSEDGSLLDPFAPANVKQLRERGLLVGLYHLTDPRFATPVQSLETFRRGMDNVGGMLPGEVPFNDAELGNPGDHAPWQAQWGRGFATTHGFKALFYSAPWWMDPHNLTIEGVAREYAGLWEAKYTGDPNTKPDDLPGWAEVMVQYTASGSVPGVQGNVDLSTFLGSREDWLALGKPGVVEPVPEPPKPDPVAEALAGLDAAVARVKDALGRAA
jgi:lysozyme